MRRGKKRRARDVPTFNAILATRVNVIRLGGFGDFDTLGTDKTITAKQNRDSEKGANFCRNVFHSIHEGFYDVRLARVRRAGNDYFYRAVNPPGFGLRKIWTPVRSTD